MDNIYYCYDKITGEYAGCGTPHIDNAETGSTEDPVPSYEDDEMAYYRGGVWVVAEINFASD